MKIFFRTDASFDIGTGHVMRCLTLAEELKQRGHETVFICRDLPGNLTEQIKQKDHRVVMFPSCDKGSERFKENNCISHEAWLGVEWKLDAEQTKQVLISEQDVECLIVDHYAIDARWELVQKNLVSRLVVIDDLADRQHECDVLLDQNYYHGMEERYKLKVPDSCLLLLGPKFSLLRKEFLESRKEMRSADREIKKVLVFFGGVDLNNVTFKVLSALAEISSPEFIVNVVIGGTNQHRSEIESICNVNKNFNLHIQIDNIARLMVESDLSIGGGGSATWERCCLGLPTIAWPIAENQKQLLKDCALSGYVYMPDIHNESVAEILFHINAVINNSSMRSAMSVKGASLVDGKGAIRVANVIAFPEVSFAQAGQQDIEKIYQWRNEPEVRKFSFNGGLINFDDHKRWFESALKDPDRYILIASVQDKEIGVVRFDISELQAEISLYLTRDNVGKGNGAALLRSSEIWLKGIRPEVKTIIAEVISENIASMKLFESCGYEIESVRYTKSV